MKRLAVALLLASASHAALASGLGVGGPGGAGGGGSGTPTITIAAIGTQLPSTGFNISGTITGLAVATGVDYQKDCTGSWVAISSPTITTTTWASTAADVSFTSGSHSVCVREQPSTGITATSNLFTVSAGAETITTVAPTGTLVTNAAYTQTGTYTNGPPTALDWSFDGTGCANAATSPTIAGGNWSFANTLPASTGSHTITVCDHTTHSIFGTSASFTVTAPAAVTWNPSDNSSLVLSNGNMTAANSATASAWKSVRATASHASGKYYFEVTCDQDFGSGAGWLVGLANSTANLTGQIGGDANSIGYQSIRSFRGDAFVNGANPNGVFQQCTAVGQVLGFAVDFTAKLWWAKNVTSASAWNAGQGGTQDPPTAQGGQSFSYITGALFPVFSLYYNGSNPQQGTANFGATAYTGTPPSGFGNW